jgi:hypothetical protein
VIFCCSPPCTGVSTLVEEFTPYREEEEDNTGSSYYVDVDVDVDV